MYTRRKSLVRREKIITLSSVPYDLAPEDVTRDTLVMWDYV